MRIVRHGTAANFGDTKIELDSPSFEWSQTDLCMTVKQRGVWDFCTTSRHDYRVQISLKEITNLLQELSEAAFISPGVFKDGLQGAVLPLIRLQAVAAGIVGVSQIEQ